MALGLPEINIVFKTKGVTAIERSARGIVACIIKDDTEGGAPFNIYKSVADIDFIHYSENNYGYLKLLCEGKPITVIVIRLAEPSQGYAEALKKLKDLKWNYLTIPGIKEADVPLISSWIKEQREQSKKTFKAVLPKCIADHEGIVNFTTDGIASTLTGKVHGAAEYCARVAGVLAGLSLARSSTYYVLSDISTADVPDDPDVRINAGELVVVFDSEKYKIGRGVNSLTTFTPEKGEDIRKIKVVEGMDLYQDDIRGTYEDYYVGKVINDYDNKQAFVAAIGSYQKELLGNVLDRSYDNLVRVNVEAQRLYLESKGADTSEMDDMAVAKANTGSKVFLASSVKFVDAMEDLNMEVNM